MFIHYGYIATYYTLKYFVSQSISGRFSKNFSLNSFFEPWNLL